MTTTPTASAELRELLLAHIRDVPDYPEPGVMFKDITPLLADAAAFGALVDALAALCTRHGATKVVGLEARGFILAAPPPPAPTWASYRSARRASCPVTPTGRRTSWSTAPRRSRCTPTPSPPRIGCW